MPSFFRLIFVLFLAFLAACAQRGDEALEIHDPPVKPAVAAIPQDKQRPPPATEPIRPAVLERDIPPLKNASAEDLRCLAKTIYFEARGESLQGQIGVAAVVLNRVRHPRFPDTICDVVHQGGEDPSRGCQFSWWCDGRSDTPREAKAWARAQRLAREMIAGVHPDRTGGALFYHHRSISPFWRSHMQQTVEIDQHVYYHYRQDGPNQRSPATGTGTASASAGG
jgi:spore germination cell wall hydrolase CwlJ-like protein